MENTFYGLTPSLLIALALYWGYCIIQGLKNYPEVKSVRDYFIVNRSLSPWIYVFAATATSFSGWTFMGHPAQIYSDGFPGAYASFYAITIPFTGLFFLKRQWILGKRYGFISPADMFSAYFNSKAMGWLVIAVALLFSIFYIAVQLRATGFLFEVLTDGKLSTGWGMFILSIALFLYVLLGGLRAVAYIDTMQAILLTLGIVTLGFIVLHYVGGWEKLNHGIGELVKFQQHFKIKLNEAEYSHYMAVPSLWENVWDKKAAYPSVWTSTMTLSFMIALMGIQASPAFSMWAFSNKNPAPFATQQVWASSFIVGGILIIFTAIQGMGLHLLGTDAAFREAHPEVVNNLLGVFLGDEDITVRYQGGTDKEALIPLLIRFTNDIPFWLSGLLTGLLAISALAAIQSTAASYMVTAGSMTSHQIFSTKRFSGFSEGWQLGWARGSIVIITFLAGLVAWTFTDSLPILGGAAVAFGLQMVPALICLCWGKWSRWLTGKGVAWGLILGILTIFLTEGFVKHWLSIYLSIDFKIGQWPWTIHSAVWGLVANFILAVIISFFTQNPEERRHRQEYHDFLEQHASLPESKQKLKIWAWIGVPLWFLVALGPGVMLGNSLLGLVNPMDPDKWWLGMPPIWIWQIFWWLVGVVMMWFLAYFMELSVNVKTEIKPLKEEAQI